MKKLSIIVALFGSLVMAGCGGTKREPSIAYMPDMAYSRAYETYAQRDSEVFTTNAAYAGDLIFYNNMPVPGTVARGQEMLFHIPKDAPGDSTNYIASRAVPNPITTLSAPDSTEAERLYLIQCAICHGTALDGNGPLFASGKFTSKPATLAGDPKYEAMPEGQMFYSVTYGKNMMGAYGPQLNTKQRWMVIHYIKSQQAKKKAGANATGASSPAAGTTNTGAGKDTTAAATK
jgi:mono/diheme cytochrome c family protein